MLSCPGENPVRLLFRCSEGRKFDCALHASLQWILILIQIYSGYSRTSGREFSFLHAASPHPRQLLMGCSPRWESGWMEGTGLLVFLQPVSYWQFLLKRNLSSMFWTETFPKVASFKWKNMVVVFWFCIEGLKNITYGMSEWQLFATFWALPFCCIQKSKELIVCHFCVYFERDVSLGELGLSLKRPSCH